MAATATLNTAADRIYGTDQQTPQPAPKAGFEAQLGRRPSFSLLPNDYAQSPLPSLGEWTELWTAWDLVSRSMIPEQELLEKPINLRNCCLFYLGHIPTFLDIHLTRATKAALTEPSYYPQIFERGIDPDVENPELCHSHSEIPDEWPELGEILEYSRSVRQRTARLYEDGSTVSSPVLGHALWLGFEHEVMHLETLLYMLLQSEKTLPPPGPRPDFAALAREAQAAAKPASWVPIPTRTLAIGTDDSIDEVGSGVFYGWDNEKPSRERKVHAFEACTCAITNGEYAEYVQACNITGIPASWNSATNSNKGENRASAHSSFIEDKSVKTVFGPVPLAYALQWPVMASYDELAGYAKWREGRIPTTEEAQSIYAYAEELGNPMSSNVAKTIPAVNGHLSNDGVEETPPQEDVSPGLPDTSKPGQVHNPTSPFANLDGRNVGFKAFHPLPVSLINGGSDKLAGVCGLGGVWEWTSSVLERHEGFEAMKEYPGYTADFFDGKHNIVLGGSWATHPRIAGRKSFVNWYQRNYPYAWCGARLVRDIQDK